MALLGACVHVPERIAPDEALAAAIAAIDIPSDAHVLVGSGDIASCDEPEGAAATAALVGAVLARAPNAVVFTTGDHAYPDGTAAEFSACYDPLWGPFNARTAPTPGNHDYETPEAAGYFGYFDLFRQRPGAVPTGYYSFELGNWRIVALNSLLALDRGASQLRWLEALLAEESADCLLAFWHHPLRSSAFHGYLPWDKGRRTVVFWELLARGGGDIVLNSRPRLRALCPPR
jgi:acid phosphatase type 7